MWLFDLYDDELGAVFTDPDRADTEIARPFTLRAYFNVWVRRMRRFAEYERRVLADELLPFSSNVEALADAEVETKKYLHTVYRAEQEKLLHFNIVMHTFIPTYDDRHPRKQFATYHLAGVYLSDKHHSNPFHSG